MAIQNTSSRPLNDESEDEKRKRKAAEDYLKNRDAFRETLKPGYTVDMTGEDTSKMSDDQIKAEANRRIGETKTNFQSAFSAARDAGFGSDPNKAAQAAQDYLNKGQARIVGDTLVGSAAGISASEWDKRDKSVASGNNPLMPKPEMVEVAQGVKMGASNKAYQDFLARPTAPEPGPNYAKANEAIQRMVDTKRDRETKGGVAFEAGRAKWNETLKARENDRIVQQQAEQERRDENRNYADLNAARRSMMKGIREGKVIDPSIVRDVNTRLARSAETRGGGGTINVDEQKKSFISRVGSRINPYDPSTAASPPVASPPSAPTSPTSNSGGFSLSSGFVNFLDEETPEQKEARKALNKYPQRKQPYTVS